MGLRNFRCGRSALRLQRERRALAIALRQISCGEEIYAFYGEGYWRARVTPRCAMLEKYGLPANAQGVDLMKHAVQRRAWLTAGKALGIEQLPKRHATAEEQLQRGADDTAGGPQSSGREAAKFAGDAQAQLLQQCASMLEQAASKGGGTGHRHSRDLCPFACVEGAIPAASTEFLQELLASSTSVPSILCLFRPWVAWLLVAWAPGLAGLPGGNHGDCSARMAQLGIHVKVLHDLPSAEDFFTHYVLTGTPLEPRPIESGEHPMPYYLGKVPLQAELPELAQEVTEAETSPQQDMGPGMSLEVFSALRPIQWTTLFCSQDLRSAMKSTTFPVSVGLAKGAALRNLMVCLCGQKRIWLYPPGDARYVYPISKDLAEAMQPEHCDGLKSGNF
eukprot:Skav219810  [mRNA]  locus=scaffold147:267754:274989:- [translate_table: standard]